MSGYPAPKLYRGLSPTQAVVDDDLDDIEPPAGIATDHLHPNHLHNQRSDLQGLAHTHQPHSHHQHYFHAQQNHLLPYGTVTTDREALDYEQAEDVEVEDGDDGDRGIQVVDGAHQRVASTLHPQHQHHHHLHQASLFADAQAAGYDLRALAPSGQIVAPPLPTATASHLSHPQAQGQYGHASVAAGQPSYHHHHHQQHQHQQSFHQQGLHAFDPRHVQPTPRHVAQAGQGPPFGGEYRPSETSAESLQYNLQNHSGGQDGLYDEHRTAAALTVGQQLHSQQQNQQQHPRAQVQNAGLHSDQPHYSGQLQQHPPLLLQQRQPEAGEQPQSLHKAAAGGGVAAPPQGVKPQPASSQQPKQQGQQHPLHKQPAQLTALPVSGSVGDGQLHASTRNHVSATSTPFTALLKGELRGTVASGAALTKHHHQQRTDLQEQHSHPPSHNQAAAGSSEEPTAQSSHGAQIVVGSAAAASDRAIAAHSAGPIASRGPSSSVAAGAAQTRDSDGSGSGIHCIAGEAAAAAAAREAGAAPAASAAASAADAAASAAVASAAGSDLSSVIPPGAVSLVGGGTVGGPGGGTGGGLGSHPGGPLMTPVSVNLRAFNLFAAKMRPEVRVKHPEFGGPETERAIGMRWNALGPSEREVYLEQARKEREALVAQGLIDPNMRPKRRRRKRAEIEAEAMMKQAQLGRWAAAAAAAAGGRATAAGFGFAPPPTWGFGGGGGPEYLTGGVGAGMVGPGGRSSDLNGAVPPGSVTAQMGAGLGIGGDGVRGSKEGGVVMAGGSGGVAGKVMVPAGGGAVRVPGGFIGPPPSATVGQAVHGVLDGAFNAGFFVTLRVAGSATVLRGVVFAPGAAMPVTPANDVAPGVVQEEPQGIGLHAAFSYTGEGMETCLGHLPDVGMAAPSVAYFGGPQQPEPSGPSGGGSGASRPALQQQQSLSRLQHPAQQSGQQPPLPTSSLQEQPLMLQQPMVSHPRALPCHQQQQEKRRPEHPRAHPDLQQAQQPLQMPHPCGLAKQMLHPHQQQQQQHFQHQQYQQYGTASHPQPDPNMQHIQTMSQSQRFQQHQALQSQLPPAQAQARPRQQQQPLQQAAQQGQGPAQVHQEKPSHLARQPEQPRVKQLQGLEQGLGQQQVYLGGGQKQEKSQLHNSDQRQQEAGQDQQLSNDTAAISGSANAVAV